MKLKLVLPLMMLLGALVPAKAQITLTVADAPAIGDAFNYATDTLPQNVSIGEPGANQTWDFSNLQAHFTSTIGIISPTQAPNSEDFPTANLAQALDDGSYGFASVTSSGVIALGSSLDLFGNDDYVSVIFDPVQTIFAFPTTFGTTFSGAYGFTLTLDGSIFDVDSIRIQTEATQNIETDAYGTLILPTGSYQALRQRVETVTENAIFALFFGTWLPLENSIDTNITYQWLTEEAKGQALTVELSEDAITSATWLQSVGTFVLAPVANFTFELPGGGEVQFADQSSNDPTEWSWDFGDLSTSNQQNPVHTYTNSGTYEVCLTATNSGGTSSSCQDITVTIVANEEVESRVTMKVSPNPAGNWITFETKNLPSHNLYLNILNLSGQQVFNTALDGNHTLDISQFAAGSYLYLLRNQDGRIVAEGRFEKQ
ncbi:MAG: PKD domain-containing protein [Saprospiraceae bacterium]|nr:PKD domain-containing protein [Saprospiraceae bacterium]